MVKLIFLQQMIFENLGQMYLSAILKKNGHECDVFIQDYDKNIVKKAISAKPEVIAFSCITGSHKWVCNIANEIKKQYKCITIMGGPHPTYFPEVINEEGIDVICRGEGEYAILELANALRDKKDIKKIKNLWVKKDGAVYKNDLRPLNQSLDDMPFPDRELYYNKYRSLRNNPSKRFLTTRGCPFSCTYCYNHSSKELYKNKGTYIRRRSAEKVIEEILYAKSKYLLKRVQLIDDTFILNPEWVENFLDIYKEKVKLPLSCSIRAGLVSENLFKKLSSAGCDRISFSIETGNEYLRNSVLKKGITNKQIVDTAKLMKKYKIKFRVYNILGLPGETLGNAFETILLNREIKTDYPWCSILHPYPKTEMYDYLLKGGYLEKRFSSDDYASFFWVEPKNMKIKKEIVNLQKFFFYAVKFPWLDPAIKLLIKLPPNKVFEFIFCTGFAYTHIGSEKLNVLDTLWLGVKNSVRLFFKEN